MNNAVEFLKLLRPEGPWVITTILPDARSTCTRSFSPDEEAGAEQFIASENASGKNIYYSLNPTTCLDKKSSKADITHAEYFHIDADPSTWETSEDFKAQKLPLFETFEPKPKFILDSGNGLQGLWPIVSTDCSNGSVARLELTNAGLATYFGASRGTQNIDRILRLPGTINYPNEPKRKNGRQQCEARLLRVNDTPRYSIKIFDRFHSYGTIPPDASNMLCEQTAADRSALLFAFINKCLRARIAEDIIIDAALNSRGAIRAHIDDQSQQPQEYMERQVRQAKTKAKTGAPPKQEENADDDLIIIDADKEKIRAIKWLWPGRFARGKFGLIAGLPDMGKGQIAAFVVAALTNEVEFPCDEGTAPQGNVLWFNAEDSANDTVIPRLIAANANLKRVKFAARKSKTFSLVTDLELLRKKIERIGNVIAVIIDPVSAYVGVGKVDGRSQSDIRSMLTPMKDLAEELNIAIIGIAHFNKKDDVKSALLRVSDSLAWVAAARSVYAVLEDPESKECKLFVKAKNNLAPDTKALRYGFGVKIVGRDGDTDISAPYVVWHPNHVTITANEAMAAAGGHTAKREAREFLLDRLEGGPVKSDELFEEAGQNGITKTTLRRAQKELGIKPKRHGGSDGAWFWELPPNRRKDAQGGK